MSLTVFYWSGYTYLSYLLNLFPTFVYKWQISELPDVCLFTPSLVKVTTKFLIKKDTRVLYPVLYPRVKQSSEKKMQVQTTSDEYLT